MPEEGEIPGGGEASERKPLLFGGIEVTKRKKSAEALARAIVGFGSDQEFLEALQAEGLDLEKLNRIHQIVGSYLRTRKPNPELEELRSQAVERIQGAHALMMGLPKDLREPGDTWLRDSLKASWAPGSRETKKYYPETESGDKFGDERDE